VLLVLLFVAAGLSLIVLDNRGVLDPMKTGLRNLVEPVLEFADRSDDTPSTTAEQQIYELEQQRDALLAENAQLRTELADFEKLREVLAVKESKPGQRLVVANVIGGDPTGLQKMITIDKGSRDGIMVGMAVVDPNFFVGLVTSVEDYSARVTLAIDATASVAGQLLDSQSVGIVYGQWQSGGRMELRHVDRSVTPAENEIVVTSAATDARTAKVPAGLVIGKVIGQPVVDNQADAQTIQVLPAVDFDNLTIVAVIVADDGTGGP